MIKNDYFIGTLNDKDYALQTLYRTLKYNSKEDFLITLHNVAIAQGFTKLAKKAGIKKEELYKILHPLGNPKSSALTVIIEAMGFELYDQYDLIHRVKLAID